MKASEILRTAGKKYNQMYNNYGKGKKCRCAMGVLMSEVVGWKPECGQPYPYSTWVEETLKKLGLTIYDHDAITCMNDGKHMTFNEIAQALENNGK